jgi:hypothetical protein
MAWNYAFQFLIENSSQCILSPAKASLIIETELKIFHDKQKLMKFTVTELVLQKILKGILQTE